MSEAEKKMERVKLKLLRKPINSAVAICLVNPVFVIAQFS